MQSSLYEPTLKLSELLKIDPKKIFWQTGDYAAQSALNGIYKVFVKIATPNFLLDRSRSIVVTFYKNTSIEITKSDKNEAELLYKGFNADYKLIMYRIAGWIDSSMRFTKAKDVVTKLVDIKEDGEFEFSVNTKWN